VELLAGEHIGLQLPPEVVAQPAPPGKTMGAFNKVSTMVGVEILVAVQLKVAPLSPLPLGSTQA